MKSASSIRLHIVMYVYYNVTLYMFQTRYLGLF